MQNRRQTLDEALHCIGIRVDDVYGARIGTVEDVLYDPETIRPVWLLVKSGRWNGQYLVIPMRDWIPSATSVWIPRERRDLREGPVFDRPGALSRETELDLCENFGFESRAREIRDRPEGSSTARPSGAQVAVPAR